MTIVDDAIKAVNEAFNSLNNLKEEFNKKASITTDITEAQKIQLETIIQKSKTVVDEVNTILNPITSVDAPEVKMETSPSPMENPPEEKIPS